GCGVRFGGGERSSVVGFGGWWCGGGFPALRFAHGRSSVSAVVTGRFLGDWAYPVHVDALVSAVPAGRIAKLAPDAFLLLDAGDDFVVEVKVFPFLDAPEALRFEVRDLQKAFSGHPVGEAIGHLFDDAITVVHDGGADLNRATS